MFKFCTIRYVDNEIVNIGPYFTKWTDVIGKKKYYTKEEVLSIDLPESVKKRVPGMRSGSKVLLGKHSSSSAFYLIKASKEEVDIYQQYVDTSNQLKEVREKIDQLVPADLREQERNLEKLLKQAQSKWNDIC